MGSGKLREGMINQHSMFLLGFFLDFLGEEGEGREEGRGREKEKE